MRELELEYRVSDIYGDVAEFAEFGDGGLRGY
jgi:hypothetical protein